MWEDPQLTRLILNIPGKTRLILNIPGKTQLTRLILNIPGKTHVCYTCAVRTGVYQVQGETKWSLTKWSL